MAVTANTIFEGVKLLLQDEGHVSWSEQDMLYWLNDGILRIIQLKPETYAVNQEIRLSTYGSGCQYNIPDDSIQFLSLVRNVNGRAINYADKKLLDAYDPGWMLEREAGGETTVKEFLFDPKTPRKFFVYPSNNGTGEVELVTSKVPPKMDDPTENIPIDDVFQPALIDYVAFRCYEMETESGSRAEAERLFGRFLVTLGLDSEVDAAHDPKQTEEGGK